MYRVSSFVEECPHCETAVKGELPDSMRLVCCNSECQQEFDATIPDAPAVRCTMKPAVNILEYRITSEDIRVFLGQKVRYYQDGTKLELVVNYTEKRKNKKDDPHCSYASLRVAFSDAIIERKGKMGWFESMGEQGNVKVIESVFKGMIQRYGYNKKALDNDLDDYKRLEFLENRYGITQQYLEEIRRYANPHRIPTNNNDSWIFFSARPEEVIRDMLEDPFTNRVGGRMEIVNVTQINKEVVEFTVHVRINETETQDNPEVRQLLLGKKA